MKKTPELQKYYDVIGNEHFYRKMSYKKGLDFYLQSGYTYGNNKNYLRNGNTIVHYNEFMKAWIEAEVK